MRFVFDGTRGFFWEKDGSSEVTFDWGGASVGSGGGAAVGEVVSGSDGTLRVYATETRNNSNNLVDMRSYVGSTTTTSDATVATSTLFTLVASDTVALDAVVTAKNADSSQRGRWSLSSLVYRELSSTATLLGTVDAKAIVSTGSLNATFLTSGNTVQLELTGITGSMNWGWEVRVQRQL